MSIMGRDGSRFKVVDAETKVGERTNGVVSVELVVLGGDAGVEKSVDVLSLDGRQKPNKTSLSRSLV